MKFLFASLLFVAACGGGVPNVTIDGGGNNRPDSGGNGNPDGPVTGADADTGGQPDGSVAPVCPGGCPSGYTCGTANGIPVCRDDATGIPMFKHIFVIPFENMT